MTEIQTRRPFTSAVILAAGQGMRFGREDGTKQNIPILGVPCVARAALAFERCPLIDEIVLVGRRDELSTLEKYAVDYSLKKVSRVVAGGNARYESSAIGVKNVDGRCRYVAIHDGARCLVTPDIIENTVRSAYEYGAAAAAERVVDTVKYEDGNGFIESTVDRDRVWLVKTPQVFSVDIYRECIEKSRDMSLCGITDDCMAAERLGYKIKLVDCGKDNIKLTSRDDLELCEYIAGRYDMNDIDMGGDLSK